MPVRPSTSRRKPQRKSACAASAQPANPHDADPHKHFYVAVRHPDHADLEATVRRLRESNAALNASVLGLTESRRYFSDLFQTAPVGYIVHDYAGGIIELNQTARQLVGMTRRSEGMFNLAQFVPPNQVESWLEHMRHARGQHRATTELLLRARGTLIPVEMVTVARATMQQREFHTVIIDITHRRGVEAEAARSRQDYQRLVDTVEGIVWEADARTLQLTFISRYAERLLGYRPVWTQPIFWENRIYVEDRERVTYAAARAVANRQPLTIDYRVVTADRRILWLHDNITTIERDSQLRLLGVAVDVTERYEKEQMLRRAQVDLEEQVAARTAELRANVQELESFSYSISHDLRAPLRAMLGFAELAMRQGQEKLPPEIKEFLERIVQSGMRADKLVQDVLAYSRVSRVGFQLAPINLDKFVRDLITQYPEFQPPRAEVRVRSPLLSVLAHDAILGQCLTNLLSNAVKFVAPGVLPHVEIKTEPVPSSAPAVCLSIQDNGIGIKPNDLGRIFNMFERVNSGRDYAGTGIGLAIVRKGIERIGGAIGVESEPGKGSRFWVQLRAT